MTYKKAILPLVLFFSLVLGQQALADSHFQGQGQSHKRGKKFKFLKNLPQDKKQQVLAIIKDNRSKFKSLRQKFRSLHDELEASIKAKDSNWESVAAKLDQVNQVKNEMSLLKTKMKFDIYKQTGILIPHKKKHRGQGSYRNQRGQHQSHNRF